MLLNQKFDRILIGQNYLSLIAGLALLRAKRSVLLIDDHRVGFDTLWGHHLSYLDFQYLQLWGIMDGIEELICLEQYLQQTPIKLSLGKRALYLGGRPYDNFNECLRKFPDVFKESSEFLKCGGEEFNQDYEDCVERLGEVSFRFKNLSTISGGLYREMQWPFFNQLLPQVYGQYQRLLKERPEHPFVHICYLAKSLYHRDVFLQLNEFEMGHLLLCLLGPVYRMDDLALEQGLKKRFLQWKGRYKRSTINSWQVDKNCLAHIELSSFEGVIAPGQCYFMGQLSAHFPFRQ